MSVLRGGRVRVPGWRALGRLWLVLLVVAGAGALVLEGLGPPAPPARLAAVPAAKPPPPVATPLPPAPAAVTAPPPAAPGAIAAPDPALLEPSAVYPGGLLPRIAADGRAPLRVYAAAFNPADPRPRVAVLLGGIGLSQADSAAAIATLPPAISLAVSPYADQPAALLAAARAAGHELFVSLPMEPARYPLDDPGDQAMLTGNPPALNAQRLEWALTRFTGYVGATGALNGMRGERFADAPQLIGPVMQTLAGRGLLYIDPRPGAPRLPAAAGRAVDLVLDEPAAAPDIDAALARLEAIARDRGSALGLADLPRPVTVARLAAWASRLQGHGLLLAPVSAIAQAAPPAAPPPAIAATANDPPPQ